MKCSYHAPQKDARRSPKRFRGGTGVCEAGAYFLCDRHGDVTTASVENWIDETDLQVSFLGELPRVPNRPFFGESHK
jgi:hypothetical protein